MSSNEAAIAVPEEFVVPSAVRDEDSAADVAIQFEHVTKMYKLFSSDKARFAATFSKRIPYKEILANKDLSFTIHRGEAVAFLGSNGAGKSTTIRALLGQLRLSSGTVAVFGQDAWRHAVDIHSRLAYVPGDTALWPNLTGGECIDLLVRLRGSQDAVRRDELVERFELDPTRRIRGYSKGNRQKVALIAAFACRAELLLLDEPTSGLDPVMEERFLRTVREERDRGATVLLSTHIMSEVEALCDSVTIVKDGRTAYSGTLAGLRERASARIRIREGDGALRAFDVPHSQADRTLAELLAQGASVFGVDRSMERIFLGFYEEEEG